MPERRRDPSVFDQTADLYSAVRPDYPDELVQFVADAARLEPGARLLELGCGPGLATLPFARLGYQIVALDQSARMLVNARARLAAYPNVSFLHTLFEDWEPDDASLNLVYAGMAWHWMPRPERDRQVAAALRPGGTVAILVNWPVSLWVEGQDIYTEHWPGPPPTAHGTIEDRIEGVRAELADAGFFALESARRWPRSLRHDADSYIDVLNTYSNHVRLPDDVRVRFLQAVRDRIAELGGTIERPFESIAMIARRVDN